MINLISYVFAFFAFVAIISALLLAVHYLIFGLGWLIERVFNPFLFK